MKLFPLLISLLILTSYCSGQKFVDKSKTRKATKDGTEITLFEEKPFTGNVVELYANGNPKSNVSLKDGIANGLWQEWYENGKLKMSLLWFNGKGQGLWEYFHENGELRSEEFFNMDVPVGISKEYYNNGQLKMKWSWLNGKKDGARTHYSEAGVLTTTEFYRENELVLPKQ